MIMYKNNNNERIDFEIIEHSYLLKKRTPKEKS